MDDAVESYLTELAGTEHGEPVLVEMEGRTADTGSPSSGGRRVASMSLPRGPSAPAG
jgi:hypothetical protein